MKAVALVTAATMHVAPQFHSPMHACTHFTLCLSRCSPPPILDMLLLPKSRR